jgi:hypothetical protein
MLEQFKRVDFGEWALAAGALSVIVLTAIFVTISIRSFILPKPSLDRLAALPLDDPTATEQPDSRFNHPTPDQS